MNFIGTPLFLRVVPITKSSDYVNEYSQCQDYSDDLTKAPCVFTRLDDGAIGMDLGHCEYAFRCFKLGNRQTTHHQLEGRNTIHSRSGINKNLESSRNRLDSTNLHYGKVHILESCSPRIFFFF